MVQLVIFALVLVAVYAIKAVAVSRTHEEIAQNSASFSWMSARPHDAETAATWAVEGETASVSQHESYVATASRLRHVGA